MFWKLAILCALAHFVCSEFAAADVVTDWNVLALDAIRRTNTSPPAAALNLAILHTSIYDAVNGIRRTHKPYFVAGTGQASASIKAAASAAAHRVMVVLYPMLQSRFDTEYQNSISSIRNERQKLEGIAWGEFVATTILQWRSADGSDATVVYTPGKLPGQWRPHESFGGVIRPALLPHWGSVVPFALVSGAQFRPPAPPALTSDQYAGEVNMVKAVGSINSAGRTREQTEIAQFWAYGPGTATPPGHWNQVAQSVVKDRHDDDDDDRSRRTSV